MSYHHSWPEREGTGALPDIEVFEMRTEDLTDWNLGLATDEQYDPGWYWQFCMPGYLPDSEPTGPFQTEDEAITDMRTTISNGGY